MSEWQPQVFLVLPIERGEYQSAYAFSTPERAERWASKNCLQYIITSRVIDYPETSQEKAQ